MEDRRILQRLHAQSLSYQVSEFLVRTKEADRTKGLSILDQNRDSILKTLLADLRSKDRVKVGTAAFELRLVLSPWARSREANSRFIEFTSIYGLRRPVERPNNIPEPQLKNQRDKETDLGERAVWEYFIAAITGKTDEATVRQLLNGSDPERDMACEIIAASGERRWAPELEQLKLVNGYHKGKASMALAACLGEDAIPILERIHEIYPEESDTNYSLMELKARVEKGAPQRRMWRLR